ncbi:hypothetical protein K438DRAFT_1953331 [Mycena galopus ATCC 62051]|nr:hypothetical protein K438DRAFT_1953331 [Mycena galopus ATCC 62051]
MSSVSYSERPLCSSLTLTGLQLNTNDASAVNTRAIWLEGMIATTSGLWSCYLQNHNAPPPAVLGNVEGGTGGAGAPGDVGGRGGEGDGPQIEIDHFQVQKIGDIKGGTGGVGGVGVTTGGEGGRGKGPVIGMRRSSVLARVFG